MASLIIMIIIISDGDHEKHSDHFQRLEESATGPVRSFFFISGQSDAFSWSFHERVPNAKCFTPSKSPKYFFLIYIILFASLWSDALGVTAVVV